MATTTRKYAAFMKATSSEREPLLAAKRGHPEERKAASLGSRVCGWCSRTRRVVALSLFVGACVIFAAFRGSWRVADASIAAMEVLPETVRWLFTITMVSYRPMKLT